MGEMTPAQQKALEALRRAAKRAGEAGLSGFGCSGSFYVFAQGMFDPDGGHVNALPEECLVLGFYCDGGDA